MRAWPDTGGKVRSFHEPFDLGWTPGRGARWRTQYFHSDQNGVTSRQLPDERQLYGEAGFKDLASLNPFWQSGKPESPYVVVTGRPMTAPERKVTTDPKSPWKAATYLSGLLTTQFSFGQRYGLFRIRAQLPAVPGAFPCPLWLLQCSEKNQTEIDVVETGGALSKRVFMTAHYTSGGQKLKKQKFVDVDYTAWHDWGVWWSRDKITWYVDNEPVFEIDNPGIHELHYLLINLAVGKDGGESWVGVPDGLTRMQMSVANLEVWPEG